MVTNTRKSNNGANNCRKIRAFKRWMQQEGFECSDSLLLSVSSEYGDSIAISVKALCDLKEGDVVATIPKQSCLTVKTSAATDLIEESQLGGYLGLAVAVMYEKSLGPKSKWFQYLQLMPSYEPIALLWSVEEIDTLLVGTELHKTVKEDKALVYQDWKECIKPLFMDSTSFDLNPDFFTVDEYFAAKSLIASRSFAIDEFHGSGMVPLADLFNHKTAAEDVHFTAVSSSSESDTDTDNVNGEVDEEMEGDDEPVASNSESETGVVDESDLELSSTLRNDPTFMEMIMIKDVKAGDEVFNTYGTLGNAALLHRYGFTEPDNPFDVLNIDLDIVVQWSLSLFSGRQSRRRQSLWRKLNYTGSVSQNSEYFEISFNGEPEVELLVLIYIMVLPQIKYEELDSALSATGEVNKTPSILLSTKDSFLYKQGSELNNLLLTKSVRQALLSLADAREGLYGGNSLEDDIKTVNEWCESDRKVYHSLMLRISERRIIKKLRCFAGDGIIKAAKGSKRRKMVEKL